MGLPAPSAVLTAVARLVAESRSVRDVVTGLATILRDAIPFEELHVLRFDRAESFELYSADPFGSLNVTARRIAGPGALTDAAVGDARSRLVCTVRQGPLVRGALWLTSTTWVPGMRYYGPIASCPKKDSSWTTSTSTAFTISRRTRGTC